jgi:hypothetical protein
MSSDKHDWRPLLGAVPTNATSAKAVGADVLEIRRVKCVLTESLFKRLLRKVFPDQRKQERILVPSLVGYLGLVRSTKPYEVGDISLSGFCLLTDERWTPGTEMPITLESTSVSDMTSEYFTVQATVVRCGNDGVGFSVLLGEDESNAAYGNPLRVKWASKVEMEQFLRRLREQQIVPVPVSDGVNPTTAITGVQSAGAAVEVRDRALTQTGSD